jgi:Tfp pilus assembly protein PilF
LTAYDQAIEDFPQNVVARSGRAETLRSLGRFDEALAVYDRSIEDFPRDVFARTGRAETLRSLGRFDEALAAYDRAIEDFPQNVVARSGRAETLRSLGRFDEALAAYDRSIEDFPWDIFARTGRAETLRSLSRFDEALAAYNRATEDFPQDAFTRNARAVVLSDLGRFSEARASLNYVKQKPRTRADWFAVHIICTIDLKEGITLELAERLGRFVEECPFREQKFYFETTLAIVRIALNRVSDVRQTLRSLARRPELDSSERVALQLMEAHAEAADGDMNAAVESLASVSNVIPFEQLRLRQIKREIERRFGLGAEPAISNPTEIVVSNGRLVRLETDFWIEQANRRAA